MAPMLVVTSMIDELLPLVFAPAAACAHWRVASRQRMQHRIFRAPYRLVYRASGALKAQAIVACIPPLGACSCPRKRRVCSIPLGLQHVKQHGATHAEHNNDYEPHSIRTRRRPHHHSQLAHASVMRLLVGTCYLEFASCRKHGPCVGGSNAMLGHSATRMFQTDRMISRAPALLLSVVARSTCPMLDFEVGPSNVVRSLPVLLPTNVPHCWDRRTGSHKLAATTV